MELDLDTLTLGDFLDLEEISGRTMQWWLDFADNQHALERASDVLAVLCVTQRISQDRARAFVLKELFDGE